MNKTDRTPYVEPVTATLPTPPPVMDAGHPVPAGKFGLKNTFQALSYRNYRLWFLGQLASLVGTFMQVTAQGFLVFELTRSPAYLGYVGFAAGVPTWFLMLFGGVVADRLPRRNLLLGIQIYLMILAIILTTLTLTGLIQPWHIIIMAFMVGISHAFDAPTRHSFVFELVPRKYLSNAIALNSTMFNLAKTMGPALGGVLYLAIGPGGCFSLNAVSYLAVIAALYLMKLNVPLKTLSNDSAVTAVKQGLRYVFGNSMIRPLIGITFVMSLFGMAYMTLMPAWAVNVLDGDAATNGWLQSARGVGALVGALLIASLGYIPLKGKLISGALIVVPILLILFSLTANLTIALILLFGIGLGIIAVFNLVNASIQELVDDDVRGRVMSIYSLVFFGSIPIGALVAGGIAEIAGEPAAIIINAVVALCFALYIRVFKPELRGLRRAT
jgi:MFS family permease